MIDKEANGQFSKVKKFCKLLNFTRKSWVAKEDVTGDGSYSISAHRMYQKL